MSLAASEPVSSPSSGFLVEGNYHRKLNESIQHLLAEIERGNHDLSHFIDVFCQLTQADIDPKLESIWIYSFLTFRSHKSSDEDPGQRVTAVKNLFKIVSSTSVACCSKKSILLMAPVIFEAYRLAVELFRKHLSSKREKKAFRELKSFTDDMLGYIGLCTSEKSIEESNSARLCLNLTIVDLVRIWTEGKSGFASFFPLVNIELCRKPKEEDLDMNCVAGAVVAEAFFLRLFFDIECGIEGAEAVNEFRKRVVGSVIALRNIDFFDILVRMLLEPALPLDSLLKSQNVSFVKKVLWDAVIVVEYPFLNSKGLSNWSNEQMRRLMLSRLVLTHEAMEFCREDGDERRAVSYSSAFSASSLRSQIIRCASLGQELQPSRPTRTSPKAIIKWLLELDNRGIRVFEDGLLKRRARLATVDAKGNSHSPSAKDEERGDDDPLFYVDVKGEDVEEEEKEKNSKQDAFILAAHAIKLSETHKKKRKDGGSHMKKRSIKYFKYDVSAASDSVRDTKSDDGSSGESEIKSE